MIIKQVTQENPVTNNAYEIYEETTATTPGGKTVAILTVKERVDLDQLTSEIAQLEARLADRQAVLTEINNIL